MGKIKSIMKKKKTLIITLIVIILLAGIVIARVNNIRRANEGNKISTEKIEKRTIVKSISATGTLKSTNTKEFTTTLMGSEVKSVNVKVGDTVNVGDVLVTLDTGTLADSLNVAEEGLNITKQQTDLSINAAQKGFQTAAETRDSQSSALDSSIRDIEKSIKEIDNKITLANDAVKPLQTIENTAKLNLEQVTAINQPIVDEYNSKKQEYNDTIVKIEKAKNNSEELEVGETLDGLQAKVGSLESSLNSSEIAYNIAQEAISTAQKQYNIAFDNVQKAKEGITELTAAKDTLDAQLKQARSTADTTKKSLNSAVDNAALSLDTSVLSQRSALLTQENQISTLRDQLEKGIIRSDVSGTVTAVNVEAGGMYQGGTIVKIEGCETFTIEAQIDEYDIPDIAVGMKVKIKTDATRDEELTGRVTFVAPSATESAAMAMAGMTSTSSGDATYKIEISIDSHNSRLRIGMNARLSIITEEAENTLTVPYDAIEDREDGTSVIQILEEDGETIREIVVTKGLESDYYTEIKSEDVKEGMNVIVPDTAGGDALSTLITTMRSTSGY